MKLVPVDHVPNDSRSTHKPKQNNIYAILDAFMQMNVKYARVEYNPIEYNYPTSCNSALHWSIKHGGYPVKVVMRDMTNYLVRTDI